MGKASVCVGLDVGLGLAVCLGTVAAVGFIVACIVGANGVLVTMVLAVGICGNVVLVGSSVAGTAAPRVACILVGLLTIVSVGTLTIGLLVARAVACGDETNEALAIITGLATRVGCIGLAGTTLKVGVAILTERGVCVTSGGVLVRSLVGVDVIAGITAGTVSSSTTAVDGVFIGKSDGLTNVRHKIINPDKTHRTAPISRILIRHRLGICAPHWFTNFLLNLS